MSGELERWSERVALLRRDRAQGPIKPYKPLLLLAVLILIDKGELRDRHVFLDGALRSVFRQLLERIFPDWRFRHDIRYPFRHLANDGIWTLVPLEEAQDRLRAAVQVGAKAREILRHVACAELPPAVFEALASSRARRVAAVRLLIDTYLPTSAGAVVESVLAPESELEPLIPPPVAIGERAVEEYLEQCWVETPFHAMGIELAEPRRHGLRGRQVLTPVNAIDLLGFEAARRRWWVFELKKGRPGDAVVGQLSRYLGWIQAHHGDGERSACGVVVAEAADEKLRYAIRAHPARSARMR